jgi:hypothetical protein
MILTGGLQVQENSTGHMLAGTSLAEEGVEGIIPSSNSFVTRHLAIWLDAMLEAIQLPAGIADLDAGLADVDRDALSHDCSWEGRRGWVGVESRGGGR